MDDEILIEDMPEIVEDMPDVEIMETAPAEDMPDIIETMPPLYAPLSPPVVDTQVTNGFACDVIGYAEDILKGKPDSEYLLYGNSHLSWVLVTADHFSDKGGEFDSPCFWGNCKLYHIYQDEYIENQTYLTWFFDVQSMINFIPDDDIEHYMVYASPSFGDYPRIMGVYEDAQTRYHVLFGFLLPVVLLWVVLQQVFRRFG